MTLRLVTYNIRKGGRRRYRLISEVLRGIEPDVVVLQEAVDPWVVGEVSREIGAQVALAAPGRSVAILSRIGELDVAWHRGVHGPCFAEVALLSVEARLLGLHLSAGLSGRGERRRSREVEHVIAIAESGVGPAGVLIAGDLNAVAPGDLPTVARLPTWIRILLRVDGGISTRVVQRLIGSGFVDAYRRLNPGTYGATIPSDLPAVRLDYFLLGTAIAPRLVACDLASGDPVLLATASDHLPLVLELASDGVGGSADLPATDQQRGGGGR